LDAQPALGVGVRGAGDRPMQAGEIDGVSAAGETHTFGDLRHRAAPRVVAVVPGNEQDTLLVADVGGDRDVHVREDDDVVQRYAQQSAQVISSFVVATRSIVATTIEATPDQARRFDARIRLAATRAARAAS